MHNDSWLDFFINSATGAGLNITPKQAELFLRYMLELIKWNRTTNITRITEPRAVAIKHFLDSILITRYIDISRATIADVGSGGGFPGIPLAIIAPDCSVVVMESVGKKCAFLKHAVRSLQLSNVDVYHGRAEAYPAPPTFDLAVSRALGAVPDFYAIARKLIKPRGRIVCMKGRLPVNEIEALKNPENDMLKIDSYSYCLPEQGNERCLLILTPCFT